MARVSRPKTLRKSVDDILKVCGAALILVCIVLIVLPTWLKWCFLYSCGVIFLMNRFAVFIEDLRPRSRVPTTGKAVFITGCDSGFGHYLAQRLDDLGLQVFAGCLFPDGTGASDLKKSTSSKLHIVPLDVTSEESLEKAVGYVTENLGDNKLWAVVNNAGICDGGEMLLTSNDIIQKVINVNTFGVVKTTKAFLPLLVKYKGRVVTVASAAGRYSYGGMVSYCMSKHAAISFCDGLRLEMYRFGVKVITVEPWVYKTAINNNHSVEQYITHGWSKTPEEIKRLFSDDYLQRSIKTGMRLMELGATDKVHQVVDCLEEGVMALNPKYAYAPGTFHSQISGWLIRRLPKPIADMILHDNFSTDLYK